MTEFYDREFTPHIRSVVEEKRHHYTLDRLQITANAAPVPSLRRQHVGVWFGQLLSQSFEFGVIAVAVNPGVRLTVATGEWFYGTAHLNGVLDNPEPYEAMVDAAGTPVATPAIALSFLGNRFPSDSFPTTEMPIQLTPRRRELSVPKSF